VACILEQTPLRYDGSLITRMILLRNPKYWCDCRRVNACRKNCQFAKKSRIWFKNGL